MPGAQGDSDGADDELCPLDGCGPGAFGGGCAVDDNVPYLWTSHRMWYPISAAAACVMDHTSG
jgi:hypothetical protein